MHGASVDAGDPAKSGPGVGGSRVPSENLFSVSASTSFLSTLWSRGRQHHPEGDAGGGGGESADMAPSGRVSPQ